jgi:hypothetical protein
MHNLLITERRHLDLDQNRKDRIHRHPLRDCPLVVERADSARTVAATPLRGSLEDSLN